MQTFLLADDHPSNLLLLQRMLAKLPFQLTTASSAQDAIALACDLQPILFILDLHLPDMDGIAMTRFIRSNPMLRHIPILIVTADAMIEAQKQAFAAGCDGILIKPLERNQLVTAISNLLHTEIVLM